LSKWKVIAQKPLDEGSWPKKYDEAIRDARRRLDAGLTFLARKRDFGVVKLVEMVREEPEENPKPYFNVKK